MRHPLRSFKILYWIFLEIATESGIKFPLSNCEQTGYTQWGIPGLFQKHVGRIRKNVSICLEWLKAETLIRTVPVSAVPAV